MRTPTLLLLLVVAASACGPASAPDAPTPVEAPPAPVDQEAFEAARNQAFQLQDQGADEGTVLAALQAAHALDPTAYGVNRRLGDLYAALKLNAEALPHHLAAWEAHPEETEILLKVITLQAQLGHEDEALALLPALQADPDLQGEALYLEARIADHRGDRPAALALVERARDLPPAIAYRAHSLHGRFLFQAGDLEGAHGLFALALTGRADYKETVKGLADSSRRLGRVDEAAHWDEVLALLLELTDDEYVRKRPDARRERLERLVVILPEWEAAFQQLADLQRRAGDMDAACATIDAFLAHHGERVAEADAQRLRQRYCRGADG